MSLRNIAKSLGISVTTVSRALNGYDDVSDQTRQRVFELADKMGYRPNALARQLKMGKSNSIGLVYPFHVEILNDICFTRMINCLNHELLELGYDLILIPDEACNDVPAFSRFISSQRIDALLIAHTFKNDTRLNYLAKSDSFPFMALGRTDDCSNFAWFDFDNESGIKQAVDYLLSQGHKHIAYIGGDQKLMFIHLRKQGFIKAMTATNQQISDNNCIMTEMNRRGGYIACQTLLSQREPPTAIICDCNMIADGAASAIECYIKNKPDVINPVLITYDGLPPDSLSNYPVLTIEQSTREQVGKQIAKMVIQLINGVERHQLQVLWKPELRKQ